MDQIAKTPFYLERVDFSSPEETLQEILGEKHGERYREYRQIYHHSMTAEIHGEFPDFAHTVTLEFINRCNLNCDMCYVANHTFPKSTLDLSVIEKLIDESSRNGRTALLLGVGSEGLLYKDVRKVIEYANKKEILDIILMTNGTLLNRNFAEFLIDQEISRICISVDAATRETYEKVRGKDELLKLEANIKALAELKKKKKKSLPVVRLSFCVTELNRHEQKAFSEKWRNIVDYIDYQRVADFSYVGKEDECTLPEDDELAEKNTFCTKPFGYLNVWSNGDISPCCTFYGKSLVFGNVNSDTLEEVYKGKEMAELRQQFRTGKNINKVCKVCLASRENLIDQSNIR